MQYIENIDILKMCLDVFNDVAASISQTSYSRLHNYRVIKQQPRPEGYISGILCRGHRWVMAALRGGCLPLHVETGQYRAPKTPYHLRTCRLCSSDSVETEYFILLCCVQLLNIYALPFSIVYWTYILLLPPLPLLINLCTFLVQIVIIK